MKARYSFLLLSLFFLLSYCTRDTSIHQEVPKKGTLEVRFLDLNASCCTGNLQILHGQTIYDFNGNRQDSFLISNIDDFNSDGSIQFGDTLQIYYELLEQTPEEYPQSQLLCLCAEEMIPIDILSIE